MMEGEPSGGGSGGRRRWAVVLNPVCAEVQESLLRQLLLKPSGNQTFSECILNLGEIKVWVPKRGAADLGWGRWQLPGLQLVPGPCSHGRSGVPTCASQGSHCGVCLKPALAN